MSNQSRYILSKRIARGGMAEIFLGKAVGSDDFERICAIKRILPHHAQEKEFVEMFRTEAGICKRLQHANIVQVYDFKKVDGNYAIIMEFVNGTDLRSLLAACEKARVKLTVPMIVYIGAHVARGLHYAHTKVDDVSRKPLGIVHRDISPQNILISYDGEVKVIDFGIANYEAKSSETKPGVVKGKYSYMSPEQVSAKPLDARTDVFSLAIVLWEGLAMRRLFAAETEVETIRNVQNCVIKGTLKESNPYVDEELSGIINKALEKDRKVRYQSAAAFEKDLLKYLNQRFPEFNSSDLGTFLKQLLLTKRNEMQEDIKKLLSTPNQIIEEPEQEESLNLGSIMPQNSQGSMIFPAVGTGAKGTLQSSKAQSSKGAELTLGDRKHGSNSQILLPRSTPISVSPTRTSQTRVGVPVAPRSLHHSQTRNLAQGMSGTKANAPTHGRLLALMGATAVTLMVCLALFYSRTGVRAKNDFIEFNIKTIPQSVLLSIDNKQLNKGKYTATPAKFKLPIGRHKLVVSRQGYLSQIIKFEGGGGEVFREDNIVLEVDPKVRMAPVRIKTNRKKPVYVDINQGFYQGKIPVALLDLQFGVSYDLVAYPNYPQEKGAFRCSFTPRSQTFNNPYIITLEIGASSSRCIANSR